MTTTYIAMKQFLDEKGLTHEEMQSKWDSLKGKNWKVTNLSEHGKNWWDLNELALESLIRLTGEDDE